MTVMIKLKEIKKSYTRGGVTTDVLHDVTLGITAGEFVAIMGPSGSGKSTLMNILGALDQPSSGSYVLDDKEVAGLADDDLADLRRDRIGFVFQSFNLLPRATAYRNVMLPLLYARVPDAEREMRVRAALMAAGLPEERWFHQSNQLSGGQMQRVAIARALVNDPAIILADEPTGNLDTKTGEVVLDTFTRLNREEGRTIILVTHERDVAEHADRMVVLRDGAVVEDRRTIRTGRVVSG